MKIESGIARNYWTRIPRHVLAGSLWMRLGFIGFSIAAAAAVVLIDGDAAPVPTLAWLLGAVAVGSYAFHRAWTLINREEAPAAAKEPPRAIARATTS